MPSRHRSRFPLVPSLLTGLLAIASWSAPASAQGALPSPEAFFGHEVGADRFLADYTQLRGHWDALAAASDRMQVHEIGTTGYGQTMVIAVISAPENLARLDEIRELNEAIARGRMDEQSLRDVEDRSRAVVWIDAGMHATECIAAQNILELVWRMVSGDSEEVQRILDEVVLLVCPANPDGMEMVSKGYMATGTVGRLPTLYQRYCGHDNNRDYYVANTAESRAISEQLYRRWYPQVVYNHHQSAPRGTILFTPPFRNPFNYQFDPLVVRGIDLVSAHMNNRFAAEGKPGIISRGGAPYSTWWNGGLRTTAYFHNQIGILTEAFGRPEPTEIRQSNRRRLPSVDYPDPLPTQIWHARQTVEYLQTANFAILDLVARYRRDMLRNSLRMAKNSIERGRRDHWTATPRLLSDALAVEAGAKEAEDASEGTAGDDTSPLMPWNDPARRDPRYYVLPANAPNFADATRLVRRLMRSGIEVERLQADTPNPDRGRQLPAGSYVVRAAQAFRPHVRDMFEPQWYPDDRTEGSGEPVRPYDSSGWTLALQMGVEVIPVREPIQELRTERIETVEVPFRPGEVRDADGARWFLVDPADANLHAVTNDLLRAGERVLRADQSFLTGLDAWSRGALIVAAGEGTVGVLRATAERWGTTFVGTRRLPLDGALELRPLRVGLFDVYGGHMATGWTRWALEQYGFDVVTVWGDRVENDERPLLRDFDALVFHTGLPARPSERTREALRRGGDQETTAEDLARLASALPPFEDWSDLQERRTRITPERGMLRLRAFVEGGGTLLAMDGEASDFIAHALEDGLIDVGIQIDERRPRNDEFFVPGSLLWTEVDKDSFVGWGLPPRIAMMFRRSSAVLEVVGDRHANGLVVAARFPDAERLLASGWAIGSERLIGKHAAVSGRLGQGWYHLFGADVMYRAQPTQTFRMVWNALQVSGARSVELGSGD